MTDSPPKPRRKRAKAAEAAVPLEVSVSSQPSSPTLPPLYVQPEALAARRHGQWRLLPGDAGFAAQMTSAPLVVSEFAAAARSYPILFSGEEAAPVVLLGLERANLFVEDDQWSAGAHVPAYVRRYPFLMIEAADKSGFALAVDAASPLIATSAGEAGAPLFQDEQPAETTLRALEFCRLFTQDHQRSLAFGKALVEAGLLIDRQADVVLPDGRRLTVAGFRIIDAEQLAALPDETVLAWHKAGWLALAYHHLASLELFQALLQRQARRDAEALPAKAAFEAAEPAPVLQ